MKDIIVTVESRGWLSGPMGWLLNEKFSSQQEALKQVLIALDEFHLSIGEPFYTYDDLVIWQEGDGYGHQSFKYKVTAKGTVTDLVSFELKRVIHLELLDN